MVPFASGAELSSVSLSDALERAARNNPELAATRARAEAENERVRVAYAPENPMFGLMIERGITPPFAGEPVGSMRFWTLSQDLKFPAKYFAAGAAQKAKAAASQEETGRLWLQVRQKVITAYYRLYSLDRILALLEANLDSARKTARIAETRRSAGLVPQQDEMKAHVEETRVNAEILLAREERIIAEAELRALLGAESDHADVAPIRLPREDLPLPKLTGSPEELLRVSERGARLIRSAEASLRESEALKTLSRLEYLPDLRFQYRRGYVNTEMNAYSFGVELSIPLWFGLRQSAEASAASAEQSRAERMLEAARQDTRAAVRSLLARVKNRETLLRIYETALVPQATATLNSSEAAYRAGRISLLELLDSQRSLFQTRISLYRTLAEFTQALGELEAAAGASFSTLPLLSDVTAPAQTKDST